MWLEQPNKTLTVAGVALFVGAAIIVIGLSTLNWLVT